MTIKKNIYYLFYSLLIILFIIVLILKIVYYLNIYYFENNNCEDKYHQNNELRKGKCRHKLKFLLKNLSEKKFLELVNYLKKNLINFLRSILNKHLLNIPDIKILFILDNLNPNYKQLRYFVDNFEDNTVDIIFTIIDIPKKTIITIFDHTIVSGYHFIKYSEFLLNCKFQDYHSSNILPFISEYNMLKGLLIRPYNSDYNSIELLNDNNLLKRINFNFDFDKPKFINNNYDNNTIDVINIKTCIIYEFLLKITKVLKLDRNIRVMIPVTFRPIGNINNNVSAYILDIDMYPNGEKINFKDFNKYLEEQYYQIIAGEYFSKLNTFLVSLDGKKIRNKLDLIMSIGVFSNSVIVPSNIFFSYNKLGDNALYCNIAILNEKNIFGNIMNNSRNIDCGLLIDEFNKNGIKSAYF